MVYHDLPAEEAQKRFVDLSVVPEEKQLGEVGAVEPRQKRKRKVVKALVPKNK